MRARFKDHNPAGRTIAVRLSSRIISRNEVEKLAARILFDIMEVEKRDLAALPPEDVRRYTTVFRALQAAGIQRTKPFGPRLCDSSERLTTLCQPTKTSRFIDAQTAHKQNNGRPYGRPFQLVQMT